MFFFLFTFEFEYTGIFYHALSVDKVVRSVTAWASAGNKFFCHYDNMAYGSRRICVIIISCETFLFVI